MLRGGAWRRRQQRAGEGGDTGREKVADVLEASLARCRHEAKGSFAKWWGNHLWTSLVGAPSWASLEGDAFKKAIAQQLRSCCLEAPGVTMDNWLLKSIKKMLGESSVGGSGA